VCNDERLAVEGSDDHTALGGGPREERDAPDRHARLIAQRRARQRERLASRPSARCGDPPPASLRRGIEQFNARAYFECHETLEAIWNEEPGPVRTLFKGILQVGVGCYHLLRANYRGATIKLRSGADYLEPFAPRCMGVDVARLIADARRLHAALVALGPEHVLEADLTLLPHVHIEDQPAAE
jgi:hypothetical protein